MRLDLPGFGGSELPENVWGVGEYADFVGNFCKKLALQPDILVGHSFGGRVIIRGMAEKVFTPRKIVLIASAGLAAERTLKAKLFLVISRLGKIGLFLLPRAIQENLRRKWYGITGSSDYANAHNPILKGTFLKAIREDLASAARSVRVPALLVWGKQDMITPLSEGRRLHTLILGSRLEVIEDAGHFVHQEKAAEVAKLILDFSTV